MSSLLSTSNCKRTGSMGGSGGEGEGLVPFPVFLGHATAVQLVESMNGDAGAASWSEVAFFLLLDTAVFPFFFFFFFFGLSFSLRSSFSISISSAGLFHFPWMSVSSAGASSLASSFSRASKPGRHLATLSSYAVPKVSLAQNTRYLDVQ